jgi:hypothetical protein
MRVAVSTVVLVEGIGRSFACVRFLGILLVADLARRREEDE